MGFLGPSPLLYFIKPDAYSGLCFILLHAHPLTHVMLSKSPVIAPIHPPMVIEVTGDPDEHRRVYRGDHR